MPLCSIATQICFKAAEFCIRRRSEVHSHSFQSRESQIYSHLSWRVSVHEIRYKGSKEGRTQAIPQLETIYASIVKL